MCILLILGRAPLLSPFDLNSTNNCVQETSSAAESVQNFLSPSGNYEDLRKQYENKNSKRDKISMKLGELMLVGWTLLAEICPDPACNSNPLMRLRDGPMKCVSCEREFERNEDTGVLSIKMSSDTNVNANIDMESSSALQSSHNEILNSDRNGRDFHVENDDFYFVDAPKIRQSHDLAVAADSRDTSAKIGNHLMQGWALLDEVCLSSSCNGEVPLMRDLEGKKICVDCDLNEDGFPNLKQSTLQNNDGKTNVYVKELDECSSDADGQKMKSLVEGRFGFKVSGRHCTAQNNSSSQATASLRSFSSECDRAVQILEEKFVKAIDCLESLDPETGKTHVHISQVTDLVTKLATAINAVRQL